MTSITHSSLNTHKYYFKQLLTDRILLLITSRCYTADLLTTEHRPVFQSEFRGHTSPPLSRLLCSVFLWILFAADAAQTPDLPANDSAQQVVQLLQKNHASSVILRGWVNFRLNFRLKGYISRQYLWTVK